MSFLHIIYVCLCLLFKDQILQRSLIQRIFNEDLHTMHEYFFFVLIDCYAVFGIIDNICLTRKKIIKMH